MFIKLQHESLLKRLYKTSFAIMEKSFSVRTNLTYKKCNFRTYVIHDYEMYYNVLFTKCCVGSIICIGNCNAFC